MRLTGPEVLDDGVIWWNNIRPFHGSLYLATSILIFTCPEYAYLPLTVDVLFGGISFINHYYN